MADVAHSPTRAWSGLEVLVVSPYLADARGEGGARRLYFLCRQLMDRKAKIHFLHCPFGLRRLTQARLQTQRKMATEYESFHFVPVESERASKATDAVRDRCWSPAIGQMLEWLLAASSFDVMLVASPWLAKAFTLCPDQVYKVLDAREGFADPAAAASGPETLGEAPLDDADKRALIEGADVVWTKPWVVGDYQSLTASPVLTLEHKEPFGGPASAWRSKTPRFGFVVGSGDEELSAAAEFLRVASQRIGETLAPIEIIVGGRGAGLLDLSEASFVRRLAADDAVDFHAEFDVALALGARPLGAEGSLLEYLRCGLPVVSLGECWDEWGPRHRFHSLGSFLEMMEACESILAAPRIVEDLETATYAALASAARLADENLDAIAPPKRPRLVKRLSEGVCFVIAAREVSIGGLALDHICEAAQYVGYQAQPLFFLDGACERLPRTAIERLRSLGKIALSPETAASLRRGVALERFDAEVVSLANLIESGQLGFWFASAPADLPGSFDHSAATAFAPLPMLASRQDDAAVFDFVVRLMTRFARVLAIDAEPTPLLAAVVGEGALGCVARSLWIGDQSELISLSGAASRDAVAVLASDPASPLVALALEVARQSTRRPIELAIDDRRAASAPVKSSDASNWVPLSACLQRWKREARLPWLVVEIGRESAFAAALEFLREAGVPRLTLFAPGAPRPVVAPRRPGIVNGVMESALRLREALLDEAQVASLVAPLCKGDATDDGGWTLIWDEVARIVARASVAPEDAPPAPQPGTIRAELLLSVQGQGAFRFDSPGWTEARGIIEAFAVRPLEVMGADGIEYMAIGPQSRETPWTHDAKLCGTRGKGIALNGFAARPAPHLMKRFDVVYEGAFLEGGNVGPLRNGDLCVSPRAGDPLTALSVTIFDRRNG
jgi:hypothetical protein